MKVCSFCGKSEEKVKRIVTSPKSDICDECILLCMEVLIKEQKDYKEIQFPNNSQNK